LTGDGDREKVRRLKYWIAGLTIVPSAALIGTGLYKPAAGYAVGGAIVLLNLLGTERAVLAFRARGRGLWLALYLVKLTLTAAVIAAVLITGIVSPIALMLGITTLLLALVFDFLFFTRNIDKDSQGNGEGPS
jgi:hypothetical protein